MPPRRSRKTAGVIVALVALAYAGAVIGSGLDRLTKDRPELSRLVPDRFASQALRSQGAAILDRGEAINALAIGEAAVADAPLDPASTALLGMARFRSGDRPGAERAFLVAGQLGWRESYTQLYWMARALQVGDYRVAAMRLDALLRQNPQLLDNRQLLDPFETSPAGRAALSERMLARPEWLMRYLSSLTDVPRPVLLMRAAVLAEVAARKASLGCTAVGPLVERLVIERAELEAAALWRQHCPQAAEALVYDGNFSAATLEQSRSQFAWSFFGQSDTNVLLERTDDGKAQWLAIDTTASRPRTVARQMVLVAPGRYRLSWIARNDEGAPSDLVVASLDCTHRALNWKSGSFDMARERWSADFTADGSCPAYWLTFGVAGRSGSVRLGDIDLAAVR